MQKLTEWFRNKKKEALTALGLTILLGVTVGPPLAARLFSFATDMVGAAVALVVLAAIAILTPSFLYRVSLWAYRDRQNAIEKNPAAALARELDGFRELIAQREIDLAAFDGDIAAIDEVLRIKAKQLRPDDVAYLKGVRASLEEDRREYEADLAEDRQGLAGFEAEVTRGQVMQDIGQRMEQAAERLKPGNERGMDSDVALTALRKLASNVATARTRVRVGLERRRAPAVLELPSARTIMQLPSGQPKALVERTPAS